MDEYYEENNGCLEQLFWIIAVLFCLSLIMTSCATKKSMVEKIDTVYVSKTDTVRDVRVSTVKETEYVDRWHDREVVINEKGDTVKEKVYVEVFRGYSREQHDSIDYYKHIADSLKQAKQQKELVKVEKKSSSWRIPLVIGIVMTTLFFFIILCWIRRK